MKTVVKRWESKSGKHYVNLTHSEYGYSYDGVKCGGNIGNVTLEQAIQKIQSMVDMNYFQPDANKTPMHEVNGYEFTENGEIA